MGHMGPLGHITNQAIQNILEHILVDIIKVKIMDMTLTALTVARTMPKRPRKSLTKARCGRDSYLERQEERTQFSGSRCEGAHGLTLVQFLHMSHLKSDEMHVFILFR